MVNTLPSSPETPKTDLPLDFSAMCLMLKQDATEEEIAARRIESKYRKMAQIPNGRSGNNVFLTKEIAPELNLPPDVSGEEVLFILELEEFKPKAEQKRRQYSKILFRHNKATWDEIRDEIPNFKKNQSMDGFTSAIQLERNVMDDHQLARYLPVLDHIYKNLGPIDKVKNRIRYIRKWTSSAFNASNE